MEIVLIIIFALVGTAIGSFLNVCIDRLPYRKSLLFPSSHCDACQRRLSPQYLIPVFSYLWLRGRCRYCRERIPRRVFWVEVSGGLLLALTYWYYGLSIDFVVVSFYCYLFILITVIDLEHKLILNRVVYPALVVALIIDVFLQSPGIVDGLIGGAIGFAFLSIPAIIYRGGMGWGDVKLAALIGLVTGFPLVFVALLLGVALGGVVAGILLLLKIRSRKDPIPFGPFLSLATMAALVWGGFILNWYAGYF